MNVSASDEDDGAGVADADTDEDTFFMPEETADEKRVRLAKATLSRLREEEPEDDEIETNEAIAARLQKAVVRFLSNYSKSDPCRPSHRANSNDILRKRYGRLACRSVCNCRSCAAATRTRVDVATFSGNPGTPAQCDLCRAHE